MKLVPLNDKIIVQRVEVADRSKGGILIPDVAKEKPRLGKVLAVGEGRMLDNGTRVPINVAAGDVVLFNFYSGADANVDHQEYLILSESDVLAVVRE